jgi:Carboxypeptidase regulatory-like domain
MALVRLVVTLLLAQNALHPQTEAGSIQGIVINEFTGLPFPGAFVELTGVQHGRVLARSVKTGSDGEFFFKDVPPGSDYQVVVTGEGLRATAHGQHSADDPWVPLMLDSGQQLRNVQIKVRPLSVIRGRVLNNVGKTLEGVEVMVMKAVYTDGRRVLQGVNTAGTNSRGEYQFPGVPPGVYYVRATPRHSEPTVNMVFTQPAQLDRPAAGHRISIGNEPEGYPATYFPSTTGVESAAAIRLTSGMTATNIDITVAKVQTVRVRGSITDSATGKMLAGGQVLMQRRGMAIESNWTRSFDVRDGQFDLRAVLPGSYIILASSGVSGARLWGRMPLEVRGNETRPIEIKLSPAPDISGRIAIEGWDETTDPDFALLAVHLIPDEWLPIDGTLPRVTVGIPSATATPGEDGRFTFREVVPADYQVVVAPRSGGRSNVPVALRRAYVKSIRNGDADVSNNGLRIEGNFTGSLNIVLAANSGGLDGRILNENRQNAGAARVVLVPEARSRRDIYFGATASSTGRFQFQGVPPGNYKVFAWPTVPVGAWFDLDFLRSYEDRATPVRIEPDAAEYIELEWMR